VVGPDTDLAFSLAGREGNREIFVHARRGASGMNEERLVAAARDAAR